MQVKILVLDTINPYLNISREYNYYSNLKDDEIIFLLWQNEPCVVIGRNQNIYREIDLEFIAQNNIVPLRRFTGGGSVYHDLGNLNFTFISSQKNKNVDCWINIILNALRKEGIKAQLRGRNDLLFKGKKISGMAWLEDEKKFLIHGTLMVDLDLTKLSKCLTPDRSKFKGKGIKSVKSRVLNLKELNPCISVESLKHHLIKAFKEIYSDARMIRPKEYPDEEKISKMLKSEHWIFGKREKAQIQRVLKIEGRPLNLDIYIDDDTISNVNIYSDSLDLKNIEKIKSILIGKKYKDLHIPDVIKSI
ncbi:MAG: lipoate--protein ligase [Tissierellia bacterium]|nr:lipoate--protein ligase [Tissierellia bacterium]